MSLQTVLSVTLILLLKYRQTNGCTRCTGLSGSTDGNTEVTYQTSIAGVINPGRGAAVLLITRSSAHVPLTVSTLSYNRIARNANIVWRQWYLDDFTDSDISTAYLTDIQKDFDIIRDSGFKTIIRFAYTDDQVAEVKDATLTQVLAHIAQIKPYLQANKDVILAMQAGFVGVWGEWYYSTNFGNEGVLTDTDIQNRKDVLAALLDALPEERNIMMRTPALKQQVTGSSSALTAADYRDYTNNVSRIGHHNDCFLASATDYGSYTDTGVDYPYMEEDTKYVAMGGETCNVNPPRSKCTTAKSELAKFHWSFLNVLYKTEVYDGWKTEGCYDEIINNLGYRLRVTKAVFPDSVTSNSEACFLIELTNDGYAAPADVRDVMIVLRSSTATYTSGHITEFSNAEPWLPESGTISVIFTLHMNVPTDDYEVLLQIGDQYLSGADYNILLLNKGVPEIDTALNNLRHTISVTAGSTATSTCTSFTSTASVPTSDNLRCFSGCSDLEMWVKITYTPGTGVQFHLSQQFLIGITFMWLILSAFGYS